MKEAKGLLLLRRDPFRGSPQQESSYRLGVDIGERSRRKPHWVGKFFWSGVNHHKGKLEEMRVVIR
jgi:hypothetical protein